MSTHDKARREFLIKTAAGVGAAATSGFVTEAQAQDRATETPASDMPMPGASAQNAQAPSAPKHASHGEGLGSFFNEIDARTVAALTERIMPGAPGKPGANDAGVLNYIDLALSGAYSDQQEFYRHGLTQLRGHCQTTYKKSFTSLSPEQQDEVIGALESGKATGFTWPKAQAFFTVLRTHTMEGMFADPLYGGNKDFAGWRLVGFPGAQPDFSHQDMQSSGPFTRAPMIGLKS